MPPKSLVSTALATLVIAGISIVTFLIATKLIGPLPLSVSSTVTQKQTTFDVMGESEMNVVPDTAEVTLGINIRNNSIAAAQDQANTTIAAIQTALSELGVEKEDIKTQNYNVYPEYDYQNAGQRILGYTVNTNILVSVQDFDTLNQIIDRSTAAGANQIGGIQFILSPEKEKELTKQARAEAIEIAKENARELSNLAGMKLGKIVNVTETPYQEFLPYGRGVMMNEVAKDSSQGGATQIEPGTTDFNYSVVLSYETL